MRRCKEQHVTLFIISLLFAFQFLLFSYAHEEGFHSEATDKAVKLDQKTIETLGIETDVIKEETNDEIIKTTGQIEEIPNNRFEVHSLIEGKVSSILVNLGDEVKTSQPLAIIQSTHLADLQSEVEKLEAELNLASSTYEREKSLYEQGITAKKEFLTSEANLKTLETKLRSARSNLKLFVDQTTNAKLGTFLLKAPKAGIIVERNLAVGQVIGLNQLLFRGVDLSSVWANADIYEKDVSKVKLNQKVYVTLDAEPNRMFEGNLTYIGSELSKETRTLPVKATLKNLLGVPLKPGTFVQLQIHTGGQEKNIVIPRNALVEIDKEGTEDKHEHIIYIKEKFLFIPREIEVKPHDSNTVEVISGLMTGDVIVTQGGYQLHYAKSEHKKEASFWQSVPVLIFVGVLITLVIVIFYFLKKKQS